MADQLLIAGRTAVASADRQPLYLRLADSLAGRLAEGGAGLPSARALAVRLGLNRATVTAAYQELARRGLLVLRRGRPGRQSVGVRSVEFSDEPPAGSLDLARYAPDRGLLPAGRVLRWLGPGGGEGEAVAQYGDVWGYAPLRGWLAERLRSWGVAAGAADVLLTAGVQHALDLLLRATTRPGDTAMVEDPTYPGLPPLLAMHRLRPLPVPVHRDGIHADEVATLARRGLPRLVILTPTLHNPSGVVLDRARRRALLAALPAGTLVVEELFDPALVCEGPVAPPLAALDRRVVAVGSFSKALFPGLRVGWLSGPREVVERVAAVKRATDLSGSPFLEATAYALCRRGDMDAQLERLRRAAGSRRRIVLEELRQVSAGVSWSEPRGGFSLQLHLPVGWSSRAVAARAAGLGVWVLPGPAMSVSGRDDVIRLAYAALGGEKLRQGVRRFVAALEPAPGHAPLV